MSSLSSDLNLDSIRSFHFLCKEKTSGASRIRLNIHMDPIQMPQSTMDEPHSRMDTAKGSISELKDHPEEIAQDAAQRAKKMGK